MEKLMQESCFKVVNGSSRFFPQVEALFQTQVKKFYGDQSSALNKIRSSEDRTCEVLLGEASSPQGVIVYKNALSNQCFKLKTLSLINPDVSSGRGLGSRLLSRVVDVAEEKSATSIRLSVSSGSGVLDFYKKKGFTTTFSKENQYKVGQIEYHLSGDVPKVKHALISSSKDQKHVDMQAKKQPDSKFVHPASLFESSVQTKGSLESKALNDSQNRKGPVSCSSGDEFRRIKKKRSISSVHDSSPSRSLSGSEEPLRKKSRTVVDDEIKNSDHGQLKSQVTFPSMPTLKTCTLRSKYITEIRVGIKTHEGRVHTKLFQNYRKGMFVKWYAGDNEVYTQIINKKTFKTFEDMIQDVGYRKLVPTDARNSEHAISIYKNIPGYSRKSQNFGVCAFELAVLTPNEREKLLSSLRGQERAGSSSIREDRSSFRYGSSGSSYSGGSQYNRDSRHDGHTQYNRDSRHDGHSHSSSGFFGKRRNRSDSYQDSSAYPRALSKR